MREMFKAHLLAAILLGATATRAGSAEPSPSGAEIAVRSGVIISTGNSEQNDELSKTFGVQFPLQLDVGYRFNRMFFVGAYAQYALGLLGSNLTCGSGASCYS